MIPIGNLHQYTKCLGTFSNGNDIHFTTRFNLRIEEGCDDGLASGKIGIGHLLDHNQHVCLIYKLMLSKSPIRLTCEHFETRIALLSPRRFTTVGSQWGAANPSHRKRQSSYSGLKIAG